VAHRIFYRRIFDTKKNIPALSNSYNVTFLQLEGRRTVSRDIRVTLLKSVVLPYEVKVGPADDDGPLHLGGDHDTTENTTTNRHVSGEGTFLVDVGSLYRGLRDLVSQANITEIPTTLLADSLFGSKENSGLLLKGTLGLV
jgi:hypothetical protein